jgi:LysM domain
VILRNKFDGTMVIPYVLRQGDTLSSVAAKFHFKSWAPIWNYNTKIRPVLGSDPNSIAAGTTIFIPRSEQGYDHLITKFKALELQMKAFGDQEIYSREADLNRLQARMVWIDFAGDVAGVLVAVGGQAIRAANAVRLAEGLKGSERVAADYLASREAEKLADVIEEAGSDKAKDALKDLSMSKTSDRFQDNYGKPIDKAYIATTKTIPKVAKAVASFSMMGGKALLDAADVILDYVKPSELGDHLAAIIYHSGTADEVMKSNTEYIRATVGNTCMNLRNKIARVAKEKAIVYETKHPSAQPSGSAVTIS